MLVEVCPVLPLDPLVAVQSVLPDPSAVLKIKVIEGKNFLPLTLVPFLCCLLQKMEI